MCPREVRLLADDAAQQVLPLGDVLPRDSGADDNEVVVLAAEVTGRYVLLRLSDGTAVVLHLASGEAAQPLHATTSSPNEPHWMLPLKALRLADRQLQCSSAASTFCDVFTSSKHNERCANMWCVQQMHTACDSALMNIPEGLLCLGKPRASQLLGCCLPGTSSALAKPDPIPPCRCWAAYRRNHHQDHVPLLSAGKEGERLEVLGAATEALTRRPAVHFPAAITAACLTWDRSGWLARNAHTITGADRWGAACAA